MKELKELKTRLEKEIEEYNKFLVNNPPSYTIENIIHLNNFQNKKDLLTIVNVQIEFMSNEKFKFINIK